MRVVLCMKTSLLVRKGFHSNIFVIIFLFILLILYKDCNVGAQHVEDQINKKNEVSKKDHHSMKESPQWSTKGRNIRPKPKFFTIWP